eukprot:2226717-Pleurochrysis_carterae.AAC.3
MRHVTRLIIRLLRMALEKSRPKGSHRERKTQAQHLSRTLLITPNIYATASQLCETSILPTFGLRRSSPFATSPLPLQRCALRKARAQSLLMKVSTYGMNNISSYDEQIDDCGQRGCASGLLFWRRLSAIARLGGLGKRQGVLKRR